MNDLWIIALFLVAWIALNRWILPAMGIETCMSGGCCGNSCRVPATQSAAPDETDSGNDAEAGK